MQCCSCQFENMPGSEKCARCGASLVLATAAIDVHPPRASGWSRSLPRVWTMRRVWYQFRDYVSAGFGKIASGVNATSFDTRTCLQAVIPGLVQIRRGDTARGRIFFLSYVAFIASGTALTGTAFGGVLLGLAFSVHLTSIVDALVTKFASLRDRIGFSVLCGLLLFLVVYLPIGWCVSRIATPIQLLAEMGPFQNGDVVWYNRSSLPSNGSIVLYNVPAARITGRTERGQAAQYQVEGLRINRIVATGGQTTSWKDGKLYVDGRESPWQPKAGPHLATGTSYDVPNGYYYIPAEDLLPNHVRLSSARWQRFSAVRADRVVGIVRFRSWPISRVAFVR